MPVHREWFMTVAHPAPWGWKIAAYMWTKAIAAGVLIVAAMLLALGTENESVLISIASPIVAMIFTGLTALILIFDLKRPDRFYYLLTKPNLRSWVVIGAYILIGYGGLSFGWLFRFPLRARQRARPVAESALSVAVVVTGDCRGCVGPDHPGRSRKPQSPDDDNT